MEAKSLLFMSEFVKLSVLCGKVMKTIYGHVVSFLRFRIPAPSILCRAFAVAMLDPWADLLLPPFGFLQQSDRPHSHYR